VLDVKNRIIKIMMGAVPLFSVAAVLNLTAVNTTDAQNVGVPQSRVAVIDIKYILENHVAFKQAMEGLKVQFDQAGEQLKAERLRINELEMKLRELKPSTQDYNQLDEEVNRAKADWSINANKQKKEIRKRESQILWKVYYDVKTETKRYCEQNRIDLVISFNGEPIDPAQPQQVVRGVSKPIVYHQPGIDITPHILASLNNQTNQAAGPVGGIGVPPQR
tara:strand:+ start:3736 stop:4395 length:660 start_codon:yes stop_codon:yes gene_type:complete